MIDFESAIQTALARTTDQDSHIELDPYTFHPSQLAKCPRQCYTSKLGLLDNTADYGTFYTGTAIHEFMETEVVPCLDVETKREHPITLDADDLTIIGHVDCYEPGDDIVYDYKARANWYKFSPPVQRHLDQIFLYMRALNASRGQIVYISKADLEIRTWPPDSAGVDTFAFDPARFHDLIEKGKQIATTIIDSGYPTSADEIPFEKCGCWLCEKESLRFDHLQLDGGPVSVSSTAPTPSADSDDTGTDSEEEVDATAEP